MIGAAKTQSISTAIVPNYSVSLSPGVIDVFSFNGSASSPTVYSTVLNGVGPFTYSWVITGSNISIVSPSNESTKFSASGFNTGYSETAILTVTDTGNGNAETSRGIDVSFEFEP